MVLHKLRGYNIDPIALSNMQQSTDLSAALDFVSQRIEAEAKLQGEPLNEDELALLHNLPTELLIDVSPDPESPMPVPRNLEYERLCSIAKAAYQADLSTNAERTAAWKFAAAVSKLHSHPMRWLLQWGGVKTEKPSWDKWLLLLAALLVVVVGLTGGLLLDGQPTTSVRFIATVSAGAAFFLGIYFSSRRIERRQLTQTIENCRRVLKGGKSHLDEAGRSRTSTPRQSEERGMLSRAARSPRLEHLIR